MSAFKNSNLLAVAVTMALTSLPSAAADEWVVRKSKECRVQRADALANPWPNLLGTYPDQKKACEAAKVLATQDPTESKKCFVYNTESIADCKKIGVVLK